VPAQPNARLIAVEEINSGPLQNGHDSSERFRSRAHAFIEAFHPAYGPKSNF
jgi:hypothetical protein